MSFALDAKHEVLKTEIKNDCCAIAYLSAVIKGAGQLSLSAGKHTISIHTDTPELFDVINKIVKQYYGEECTLCLAEENIGFKIIKYKITIPSSVSERIMFDCGILELDDNNNVTFINGISPMIIQEDCCKLAYIKGTFVSCATSNIVIKNYDNGKSNSGYHLEFVFNFEQTASDFCKLLESFDIHAKTTVRKNNPLVYVKEYQVICDILALVGANKAVLELQNEAAIRDLRNNVNRQTNCLNANLNKMVQASVKQLNAINYIKDNYGLEILDDNLQELCLIRLANPDEPLDKLRLLYSEPISKSGINHRFSKILKIAEELKEEQTQEKTKENKK